MKGSVYTSSRPSTPSRSSYHHNRTNNFVSPPPTPPRNFSETRTDENVDYAESLITKWDLDSTRKHDKFTPLFSDDNRNEARNFLEAVTGLQSTMRYYVKLSSSSEKLIRAQKLMQIAIKRLEKEFYVILSSNRKNLDSESVSSRSSRASTRSTVSDFYDDEISEEEEYPMTPSRTPPRGGASLSEAEKASDMAMVDLKAIADCMMACGYGKECVTIYRLIRKSIVDETIYYLGFEKLSHSQMKKLDWNVLEAKIKRWLNGVRIAVKTLFHGERILCDVVFSSSERMAESCFAEISRDAAVNLFGFAASFGRGKKTLSPEKMFRALDMYEAIADMWTEIESVFSHESSSVVRSEAMAALVSLGEAVRVMLGQFEAAIKKDTSKAPSDGGVHPLTRYVMNYLIFLADYSGAVSDIVMDWPLSARTPLPESYFSSPIAAGEDPSAESITARLAWLILVLLCKLDAKAMTYEDVAQSYLFLANNVNYVVSKVRSSNLGLLMGVEWIWKNRSKVKQYLANYERMGWDEAMTGSLPEEPTAEIPPEEVRERFRRFNLGFEEAYRKQRSWVIPDPKLRDEVKMSLAKKLVPGYRAFYEKHRGKNYTRGVVGAEAIVRYAPEDLNNYLSDLFFAAGGPGTTSYTISSRGR